MQYLLEFILEHNRNFLIMKHSTIKQVILFFMVTGFLVHQSMAQDNCKVLLETISSQYDGDCKKGLADGAGTAKGTDTYTGEFKKGLPEGTGTYTWANGDVYEGEFKKGLKEGQGTKRIKQSDGTIVEQKGFWKKDEYIGEYESPYEITYRSADVLSIRVTETENPTNDGNALFIELQHKGRTQPAPNFGLNVINGNYQSQYLVGNTSKILVTRFPFGFTISYKGETVEIQIYQARSWNIRIDFNIQ